MRTIQLKNIRANGGLKLNGTQYKLKAGQTSIDLPDVDATTFEALYPELIDNAPVFKPAKKKDVAAPAAASGETNETS